MIGHLNSGTTIPASKIYSDAGIPQISPSATNPKFTRQGFKTTFRVVADDVHLGGTLGRYGLNELKGKNFAVIDDRTAYGQGVAEEFEKAAKAAGATIVGHNACIDRFGAPWPGETRPVHGESGVVRWELYQPHARRVEAGHGLEHALEGARVAVHHADAANAAAAG